jgi:hypothetical protein
MREGSEAAKGLLSNLPISLLIGGKGGAPRSEAKGHAMNTNLNFSIVI